MANGLKLSNKLVLLGTQPQTALNLASDPGSSFAGDFYFNSVSGKFRFYNGSTWQDFASGSVSLTGQSLNTSEIIVGNGSNQSAAVNTNALGDILADSTNGLTIKTGAISNSHISNSAAIAYAKLDLASSITDSDISNSAAINLSKLASLTASRVLVSDGSGTISASSITSTTLGYLDATSSIQTQLNNKLDKSGGTMSGNIAMGGNKITGLAAPTANGDALRYDMLGANNGIATLDAGGKIPVAQLPNSVMEYKGNWDASTNSPALADGVGNAGDVYRANVAGTQDLGSGAETYAIGDWVVYNGSIWQKSVNSNAVVSVNGQSGVVSLDSDDISEGATNLYFTDERAQDAIGAMLQGGATKVQLTYTDGTPELKAEIVAGSLDNSDISNSAAIAYEKLAILTANRVLVSNGAGTVSVSSVTDTDLSYLDATSSIQTQLNNKISTSLADGYILVGNNLGQAAAVLPTGDVTLSDTGVFSISNGAVTSAMIASGAVDLTTQVTGVLPIANGGTGSATQNFVDLTTNQSIGGDKTFSGDILASSDVASDIGSSSTRFANVFVGTVDAGTSLDLSLKAASNKIKLHANSIAITKDGTNAYEEEYYDSSALAANVSSPTAVPSLSWNKSNYSGIQISYIISESGSGKQRTGSMFISNDGTVISSSDQFSETAALGSASGLSLDAAISGGNIIVRYNNTDASNGATMRSFVKRFRA